MMMRAWGQEPGTPTEDRDKGVNLHHLLGGHLGQVN